MLTEFKLIGLIKPSTFQCELLNKEETFYATSDMPLDRFNVLWKYCENNWKDEKIVIVKHKGLYCNGVPKEPKVIEISEKYGKETKNSKI